MKISTLSLSIAALSLALLSPAFAQDVQSNENQNQTRESNEAARMVPARAKLESTLDARKTAAGSPFRVQLTDTVQLQHGVALHRGDTLLGSVTTDDMKTAGRSRLALQINQAVLKNGQTVPIKATIVGVFSPDQLIDNGSYDDQIPNNWTARTVGVDQIDIVSGVDLHSRIGSNNSGVFVSTRRSDVEIPEGSEIALAIGAGTGATNGSSNGE